MKSHPWIWLVILAVIFLALDVAFVTLAQKSPPEILTP